MGKVTLITRATSGMGKATALLLAGMGYDPKSLSDFGGRAERTANPLQAIVFSGIYASKTRCSTLPLRSALLAGTVIGLEALIWMVTSVGVRGCIRIESEDSLPVDIRRCRHGGSLSPIHFSGDPPDGTDP